MSRWLLGLGLLVGALACTETGVRPQDSDTDQVRDTDEDTDTAVPAREGCEEGALDAGWGFDTYSPRVIWTSKGFIYNRQFGLQRVDLDTWKADRGPESGEQISGELGEGLYLQFATLDLGRGERSGFGGFGPGQGHPFEHSALVWAEWPGPGTTVTDADGRVDSERLRWVDSDFTDLDGDGLTDLYVGGGHAVYGPLVGTFTDADLEPVVDGPSGDFVDWDDDGYDDLLMANGAWLGPISEVEPDAPYDVRIDNAYLLTDALRQQRLSDVDGDGLREVWLRRQSSERDQMHSLNFPGTGAFDGMEERSVTLDHWSGAVPPGTGDFDGDGAIDVLLYRPWPDEYATDVTLVSGPLGEGVYGKEDGMTRRFGPYGSSTLPMALGDINDDGRDDFIVQDAVRGRIDGELVGRTVLYLGCPGW